jgi:hypothetical protein
MNGIQLTIVTKDQPGPHPFAVGKALAFIEIDAPDGVERIISYTVV